MSNGVGIKIQKRDGKLVPLNVNKIHFVVEEACEGLANVSASQIEMNANIQFYDGMSTNEIQEILIRSANDLITLDIPNYQFAAARLLLYPIYKEAFGQFKPITLQEVIDKNIERGVYDKAILEKYSSEEIKTLDKFIKHQRDENFT
jgi:ribonucleoside-diphosphate reductase alpha chain